MSIRRVFRRICAVAVLLLSLPLALASRLLLMNWNIVDPHLTIGSIALSVLWGVVGATLYYDIIDH